MDMTYTNGTWPNNEITETNIVCHNEGCMPGGLKRYILKCLNFFLQYERINQQSEVAPAQETDLRQSPSHRSFVARWTASHSID